MSKKTIAYSTVAAGFIVLCLATALFKDSLLEEWYLRQLESQDAGARNRAVSELGELGLVKAIPALSRMLGFPGEAELDIRNNASHVLGQLLPRREAIPYLPTSASGESRNPRPTTCCRLGSG